MWARMGSAVTEEPTAALATFSLFCFGKGVGNVAAGPLSAALIKNGVVIGTYGVLRYRSVILFTGSCMLGSAVSVGGWWMKGKLARRL